MNKKTVFQIISLILTFTSLTSFGQVTITDIVKIEERIVMKPKAYDSLQNWMPLDSYGDCKQYIGLQVYQPPITNGYISDNDNGNNNNYFLSIKPTVFKTTIKSFRQSYHGTNTFDTFEEPYDSVFTYVYKPHQQHFEPASARIWVGSDSTAVSNTYFTIIDVYSGKKADSLISAWCSRWYFPNRKNVYLHNEISYNTNYEQRSVFLLKNNTTGDSLYCPNITKLILVPYFVKQKQTFQNKRVVFGDSPYYGDRTLMDNRFLIKYKNDNDQEVVTGKKVIVKENSKWRCTEVTLLKPDFKVTYLLQNESDQQIALNSLDGFLLEDIYLKRENKDKAKSQQVIAQAKKEAQLNSEAKNRALEKRNIEIINKFGTTVGQLISQGKVKIGMSIDMCKYAWGEPLWKSKTTTEYGTSEDLYYGSGSSLHFVNSTLKIIVE